MELKIFLPFAILHILYQFTSGQQPNIVFIVADDLGWNDVSFHGSSQIPTPNIDALAYDGIILNNYYVQPICTPTRSALLTGRFPIHTGMQHGVLYGSDPYGLSLKEKLLPQRLKEMGYINHMVGKWHLGFYAKEYTPLYRGFESHYGYYQGMEDYYKHNYWANYLDPFTDGYDFRDGADLDRSAYGKYSTEIFTERAEKLIRHHNTSKPLFLYLAHQAVHSADHSDPLQAPERYVNKFTHIKDKRRRTYAGMVAALDESVGNITKALAAAGMLNNTLIAFTTDNGGPTNGFDQNAASNWPLRGCKHTLWEGGTRGAGFVWSPLLKQSKYISHHMMHVVDWLPTLLHVAEYPMSQLGKDVDGMDMWTALSTNQKSSPRTEFPYNIDDKSKTAAVRVRNMKLILGEDNGGYNGWYPPWQVAESNNALYKAFPGTDEVFMMSRSGDEQHLKRFQSDLPELLRAHLGRTVPSGKPAVVKCGQRPANASTNCQPKKSPCLYDIDKDPCEYNNLAGQMPGAVKEMLVRLREFNATAVTPRNQPQDPFGLPLFHHGAWVPWINLTANYH